MLETVDLNISYGNESVLANFSCRVEKGTFVCLTGKSGCGKSSLLKSFMGLTPFTGEINVGGMALNETTAYSIRCRTAYLPQELSFPMDTLRDAAQHIFSLGTPASYNSSIEMLKGKMQALGLGVDLLDKRLDEVSGGQRQRFMLAAITTLDREILLLDEPTAALDAESRELVVDLLLKERTAGKTVVAVSHDVEFIQRCDTVINLEQ